MQINLTHSESEILNKFRNLIHYFFKYDCLTISRLDNQSNNAVIKLIDGVKKNLPDMLKMTKIQVTLSLPIIWLLILKMNHLVLYIFHILLMIPAANKSLQGF